LGIKGFEAVANDPKEAEQDAEQKEETHKEEEKVG